MGYLSACEPDGCQMGKLVNRCSQESSKEPPYWQKHQQSRAGYAR